MLPATILFISVILAAFFYSQLPAEAAYHFQNGSPDRWMSRSSLTAWFLVPQLVFFLLALAIISVAVMLGRQSLAARSTPVRKLLSIMGNMVALPQIILAFAMLDIFLYNAYQIHLIPLWVFAVIVMVLGGIILGVFFVQAFRQIRELAVNSPQEK